MGAGNTHLEFLSEILVGLRCVIQVLRVVSRAVALFAELWLLVCFMLLRSVLAVSCNQST
jgi:hypothetical protein